MTFAAPQMLWLLLLVLLPLAGFFWWAWRKRQQLIRQFVRSPHLANLTVGVSLARQKVRFILFAAAIGFLVLALARPQYGIEWEEVPQQGLDILVAIDTSRSMLAPDVPPNRLARAKLAALDLMAHAKGSRLGLVPFAGTAFVQCPLTFDAEVFRQNVTAIQMGIIPQGGSDLSAAIRAAARGFDSQSDNHKVLVILSDGEEHDADALTAAREAGQAGLRIFTMGIGTTEGSLIPVRTQGGATEYFKDNQGNVVKTRLQEDFLREIATVANGFYLPLAGPNPVETLYARGIAPLPAGNASVQMLRVPKERFRWAVSAAIALLLLEMFLPQRRKVRRTTAEPARTTAAAQAAAMALFLALAPALNASPAGALRDYQSERYAEALEKYRRALDRKNDDPRLHYNAGNAAFRANRLEEAAEHYAKALESTDPELQQQAFYNLGNTFYHLGDPLADPAARKNYWEEAARNFQNAVTLDPNDPDARHNLEVIKRLIQELQEQPQPSQENQGDPDSQNQEQQEPSSDGGSREQQPQPQPGPPQPEDDADPQAQNQPRPDEREDDQPPPEPSPQPQPGQDQPEGQEAESAVEPPEASAGEMTPDEARALLDRTKDQDQPLIFQPPQEPASRTFKDW